MTEYEKNENEQRWLPVTLTQEELLEKARELAHTEEELEKVELEKKAEMQTYAERIKRLKGSISVVSMSIRKGSEYRDVECVWQFDWHEGLAKLIRTDTGETVKDRPITERERELSLDLQSREGDQEERAET